MMSAGLLEVAWPIWGGLCLIVVAIYVVVWPRPTRPVSARPAWQYRILRWAHAAVWLVLAGSCFLRVTRWPGATDIANALALLAFLIYLIFLGTVITDRKLSR